MRRTAGRQFVAMLLGVATAAALATGCGGGGSDGEADPADSVAGSAPAEYAKRATALCLDRRRQITADLDAFAERPDRNRGLAEAEVRKAVEDVILPGFRSQFEALRRLPPPRGDEDFLALMLFKFAVSLENGEERLARLFRVKLSSYSEFAEGTLMTEEYGVEGCGSLARSPEGVYTAFRLYALDPWT